MNFNPRVIEISGIEQAQRELTRICCDPAGISIMAPKAVSRAIKIESVPVKAANLLKQTFLAKGGEVAVSRDTASFNAAKTDVLILATLKQYQQALSQLRQQPWGLPDLAEAILKVLSHQSQPIVRNYQSRNPPFQITSGKTLVMGILNITPDSFSDGGKYNNIDQAIRYAEAMVAEGADIIDIGAESTRPYGSQKISAEEELDRLLPLLNKLLTILPVPVSIDTYKSVVAEEVLKLGVHLINDIWGLQGDANMASVAARYNVPVVIMHNQTGTEYNRDIMACINDFLQNSIQIGLKAGVAADNFIIDPGIGFGKTPQQNLAVMARLEELRALGCPILLGTSRKRFIGEALNLPMEERVEGTAATVALGITKGVNIVRVHDVKAIARVARMTDVLLGGRNVE
ncbi:MAG: dihydropteroate synthase [Firmicutes bacterium]|nr:dihydropteroate synthase [Bacillota bacterium]